MNLAEAVNTFFCLTAMGGLKSLVMICTRLLVLSVILSQVSARPDEVTEQSCVSTVQIFNGKNAFT